MARFFNMRGVAIGDDKASLVLPYQSAFTNSRGHVHGGALSVLFDCVLSCAARAHQPTEFGVVTIDLVTHFLEAAPGDVIAHAVCERRGRSLSFARGEAFDEQGTLLAVATGTFKLVPRVQAPARP